jgi:NTP pyrophosphatase (non-canonical NTP hydrolase)
MTYYLYHIPGKKVGVTTDLKRRVEDQQGYGPGEYEIIESSDDIDFISEGEIIMQKAFGYKVDQIPYNKLNCNKNKLNMKINVTEQTTTFPCPVNKLKGQLMDNIGMTWETDHGVFFINEYSIKWIMSNVKTSMYNKQRSYIYNKAFARFYDNHQTHDYPSNGHVTRTGGLAPTGMQEQSYECCDENNPCTCKPYYKFDLIRQWAEDRGLYANGDPKTQALKLVEEVGETCRAILKEDREEVIDGIGDCVVVLTNLAELVGVPIEICIEAAYDEIKNRTGKMVNGTYKKD